jgi:hypothetical protein
MDQVLPRRKATPVIELPEPGTVPSPTTSTGGLISGEHYRRGRSRTPGPRQLKHKVGHGHLKAPSVHARMIKPGATQPALCRDPTDVDSGQATHPRPLPNKLAVVKPPLV